MVVSLLQLTKQKSLVKPLHIALVVILIVGLALGISLLHNKEQDAQISSLQTNQASLPGVPFTDLGGIEYSSYPLQIEYLRAQEYPGSEIEIEQTLAPGVNYQRYIVSYKSEGLKQFALLAVPNGDPPDGGWPAIVFNHGYISPSEYRTTEKYVAYFDGFAKNGYVVMKPDYRGHGNSEGQPTGGYGSPGYLIDVLNAFASLQQYPPVNNTTIGMWGHSMGGHLTQMAMVINPDVKVGVIWGGVVGSYQDYHDSWWSKRQQISSPQPTPSGRGRWRTELFSKFGTFAENPTFWNSISATSYLESLSGPIQLHHASGDATVPVVLSELLYEKLQTISPTSELYVYPGDDHNISQNFSTAMSRSIEFFDTNLKST